MRRADRLPLGQVGRRLGSRVPRRRLGRRLRDRRRARLPRPHELERGAGHVVGAVRRVGGGPRRLGRHPLRRPDRRMDRPPLGTERPALHGRGRARTPARARDRSLGELVQPGAVRQADAAPVGPEDRRPARARGLLRPPLFPSDVPVRVRLRHRRGRDPARGRQVLPHQAAGSLRPLRLLLHVRPLLRGAAPDRRCAQVRAAAPERVGLGRRLHRLDSVLHLLAVHPAREWPRPAARLEGAPPDRPDDGRAAQPRPQRSLASTLVEQMLVRELELDLDAFEGPFDLLLTLVLKEELDLAEVDVAAIVLGFVERLAERDRLDLDACGEFLVLVAALLELKARGLFPEEDAELSELEPEEAAEELARRLAEYRRMKEAAGWLAERLHEERDRFFRLGPAPFAPRPEQRLAPQDPESLGQVLRLLAAEPPTVSLAHMELRFPPVAQFLERFRALLTRRTRFDFDSELDGLSRAEQAIAFLALLELRRANEISISQAAPFAPIRVSRVGQESAAVNERTHAWNARSA